MTSARRPIDGRSPQPPRRQAAGDRPPSKSGRARPDPRDGGGDASTFKKVMFYGTGVLLVVCLVLLVAKWDALTAKPPQPRKKPPAVREDLELEGIKKEAKEARRKFDLARKIANAAERAKAIQGAIEALAAARDKIAEMSEKPKYQGEDYDAVFGPELDKMQQELKIFREAKAKALSGR